MEQVVREQTATTRPGAREPLVRLDPVVVIPWRECMTLGVGKEAITGSQRNTAVERIAEPAGASDSRDVRSRIEIVEQASDILMLLDMSAAGSFNLHVVDCGINNGLFALTRCGANAVSVVVKQRIEFPRHLPGDYRLRSDAAAVSDAAAFRRQYGDYFVAGYRNSAVFYAIYYCTASSAGNLQRFVGAVRSLRADVFDESVAADLVRLASTCCVAVDCNVVLSGAPKKTAMSQSVAPDGVAAALARFHRLAVDRPSHAILWHYCRISDVLPPTAPMAPATMEALAQLYRQVRCAAVLMSGFPPRDEDDDKSIFSQLEKHFQTLRYDIQFRMDELLYDDTLRDRLLGEVSDWLHDARSAMPGGRPLRPCDG